MRQSMMLTLAVGCTLCSFPAAAQDELSFVGDAETQPLLVHCQRLSESLEFLGSRLSDEAAEQLERARAADSPEEIRRLVQATLDPLCLAEVVINPESRVKVNPGPAATEIDQNGWRVFLVKVNNQAGVTAPLRVHSPQAAPIAGSPSSEVADRWLQIEVFQQRPLPSTLSGTRLEYVPVLVYSRDAGKRSAVIAFDVGQGTQDLGFRSDIQVTFDARAAIDVPLEIKDENGQSTTASLEIRDAQGRVYPSTSKRIAPDFHFHPQVYRSDGETVSLPPGKYYVTVRRGPEYHAQSHTLVVEESPQPLRAHLKRWIDPSLRGWWSGDHHIHAAGCSHYASPTEGVHALDMMRHCLGEDLKVGANLTWGPCFDYQKQFFTGTIDPVSKYPYLLRYDVEVSGFGSHESGHLCLLRLRQQMYPGGDSTGHWPKLGLNTLRWAQLQGAVCGPAHSGWGLQVETDQLPNYIVPPFDGIGANEYIVDVTHMVPGPNNDEVPAIDFISLCDTPMIWELNIWYHTLNCGFRTRGSGETDFPCIYGQRVGIGRSYVKLDGELTYDDWCEGISRGANYISDGFSHLIDFAASSAEGADQPPVAVGTNDSELHLPSAGAIEVTATVAALLSEEPSDIGGRHYSQQPYWHLERARMGATREVPVELIVNGYPVQRQVIVADGQEQDLTFTIVIDHSSWVALRILGSSHTNPIFVIVDDQPIRCSRRSAQWCLDGVDRCWSQKERFMGAGEIDDARSAYEHARQTYRRILAESIVD